MTKYCDGCDDELGQDLLEFEESGLCLDYHCIAEDEAEAVRNDWDEDLDPANQGYGDAEWEEFNQDYEEPYRC